MTSVSFDHIKIQFTASDKMIRKLCLALLAQFTLTIGLAHAQFAPTLVLIDDCTAIDRTGAEYCKFKRGDWTEYEATENGFVWIYQNREIGVPNEKDTQFGPNGRIAAKFVLGRPESISLVEERLKAHPDDPWLLYCLAKARHSVVKDVAKIDERAFAIEKAPQPFTTPKEFLDAQIDELQEIRRMLVKVERMMHDLTAAGSESKIPDVYARGKMHLGEDLMRHTMILASRRNGNEYREMLRTEKEFLGYIAQQYVDWAEWHIAAFIPDRYNPTEAEKSSQDLVSHTIETAITRLDHSVNRTEADVRSKRQFTLQLIRLDRDVFAKQTPDDLKRYRRLYGELLDEVKRGEWFLERVKLNLQLGELQAAKDDLEQFKSDYGDEEVYNQWYAEIEKAEK